MFKSLSISVLSLFIALFLNAQEVSDAVSMSPNYAQQVFYSLQNGEVASVPLTEWDLAITADAFDAAVFVNDHLGIEVYEYLGEVSDFETLDTTGQLSARLFNSDLDWFNGALNRPETLTPSPFDYGWGEYNVITHVVTGTRIFIISNPVGATYKFMIESLDLGEYTIRYALLDGSGEQVVNANTSDFAGKNFWYLDLETASVQDLEPLSADWDITFTRYTSELLPGFQYLLTGALQNKGVLAARAADIVPDDAVWTDYELIADKNVIGYDWKNFNMDIFQWEIIGNLSYFVEDQAGQVWHIVFTGFGGAGTGDIEFTKELVGQVTSLEEAVALNWSMFPNPTAGELTVQLPEGFDAAQWSLIDMSGRTIEAGQFLNGGAQSLVFERHSAGLYFFQLTAGEILVQERLVIR